MKFQITNSVICDLCQMKLNREELANTSFDQINFNEWRLWFFKEFVKILATLRCKFPSDMELVILRLQLSSWCSVNCLNWVTEAQCNPEPAPTLWNTYINENVTGRTAEIRFLTQIKFFPLSYSLIIFDNLLNEGNKSIYRYSLAYK